MSVMSKRSVPVAEQVLDNTANLETIPGVVLQPRGETEGMPIMVMPQTETKPDTWRQGTGDKTMNWNGMSIMPPIMDRDDGKWVDWVA